jgi:glycosyltransferase involved in cell wall biosynthesis
MTPRISVAVVSRNVEAEIAGTLRSITAQTVPLELVVVDGASTDGTVAACEPFRDRIATLVSEPDGGPYAAMNKAARLATGDYVLYMNAGDCFTAEDALAGLLDGAPASADLIYGHHFYRRRSGELEWHRAADLAYIERQIASGDIDFHTIAGMPCHQATATRRALLVEEGYDTSYRIAADHARIHRMLSEGRAYHHSDATVAIYTEGGLSARQQALCFHEWYRMLSDAAGHHADRIRDFFVARVRPGITLPPDRVAQEVAAVRDSRLLLEDWYRSIYDVPAEVDAVEHYLYVGADLGHDPNPFFDTLHYLERNGDVARAGMNALLHYALHGARQHRITYPWEQSSGWVRALLDIFDPHNEPLDILLDRLGRLDAAEVTRLEQRARTAAGSR